MVLAPFSKAPTSCPKFLHKGFIFYCRIEGLEFQQIIWRLGGYKHSVYDSPLQTNETPHGHVSLLATASQSLDFPFRLRVPKLFKRQELMCCTSYTASVVKDSTQNLLFSVSVQTSQRWSRWPSNIALRNAWSKNKKLLFSTKS